MTITIMKSNFRKMGSRPRGNGFLFFFSRALGAAAILSRSDLDPGAVVLAAEIDLIDVSITARQCRDSCYDGDD